MEIGGYDVEIKKDGIKVGCTDISLEQMKELVEKVERYKKPLEVIYSVFDSFNGDENLISSVNKCIEEIRNINRNFMGVRSSREYKGKGFYLCREDSDITWTIVKDSTGLFVLVPLEK